MSTHGFTSTFAPELDRYLAFKQSMGCYGTSRIWYLRRFNTYCFKHGLTVFDGYMPKVRGLSPKTIQAYRISLECFLSYLAQVEHVDQGEMSFDHFARPHLKGWLAWMAEQ